MNHENNIKNLKRFPKNSKNKKNLFESLSTFICLILCIDCSATTKKNVHCQFVKIFSAVIEQY